jgi:hypothetical protein
MNRFRKSSLNEIVTAEIRIRQRRRRRTRTRTEETHSILCSRTKYDSILYECTCSANAFCYISDRLF